MRNSWHKQCLMVFTLLFSLCLSTLSIANAESTASIDHRGDAVALDIIRKQQAPQQKTATSQDTTSLSAPLADDLAQNTTYQNLPALNQPVIDLADALSPAENQQLSTQIRQIYDAGKGQIGIVIVPTTGQDDIFSYAMQIAEKWQLGTAKHDNGLLIVVAIHDRRIQILTGYGLEGVIPDIVAHQIIQQQITPYFKNAQYAQGLQAGVQEINRILSQDPEIARQAAESLKHQQAEAHTQQQAISNVMKYSIAILILSVVASVIVGRKFASLGAGTAGVVAGLISGLGLGTSLLIGGGLFLLIISSIAQLVLQALASGGGRGGGSSGGGFGGYRGGGGGFGGGGASGSW